MADLKISQLTGASTPLAGTEVLPIVQSGSTVKVSVANLTAGRAVGMAGGSFTDNITQSTAAKGVNFTANTPAAGMTSQLLNWYEEGTWTPVIVGSGTAGTGTYSIQLGRYTRIGRVVNFTCQLAWSAHTGTGTMSVSGLPFTNTSALPSQASIAAYNMAVTAGHYPIARVQVSSTSITLLESPTGGGPWAGIAVDTNVDALEITGSYIV